MNDIRRLEKNQINEFYNLIKTVYDKYVSHDYSDDGNKTFYAYTNPTEIEKRLIDGNLFYVCLKEQKIVGALEVRDHNHIALFFVDDKYHRQNIGNDLLNFYLLDLVKLEIKNEYIEVNSSIYAKTIYQKMGFKLESDLQEKDGIKYYYMKKYL